MKYITTIICCLAFAICGISLAISEHKPYSRHATVNAATIQGYTYSKLPTFSQPTAGVENKKDTIYIDNYVVRPAKIVSRVKPIYLPAPTREDTAVNAELTTPGKIPIDSVKNQVGVVREEQTTDSIGPPNKSIVLIVDGEEVYKR